MAATMNLILLQDVEDLGLAGDSVHVAPGFGRNYLIPRGLAAPASAVALRQLEAKKAEIEAEIEEMKLRALRRGIIRVKL